MLIIAMVFEILTIYVLVNDGCKNFLSSLLKSGISCPWKYGGVNYFFRN